MGHLFRMMNLYASLRHAKADAVVVMLGEHAPAGDWLKRAGVPFEVIPSGDDAVERSDWETHISLRYRGTVWVNDRLRTSVAHAARVKSLGMRLVTFDDTGDGAALADVHVAALAKIRGDDPQGIHVLTGLEYLILSPDIARNRRLRTECRGVVVSLGGSDTHGVTVNVVQWLTAHRREATVILGPGFLHDEALKAITGNAMTVKRAVSSLAEEFAQHDLAITGGGMTAFEAAASGLPTVTIANESFEVPHCRYLQEAGCSLFAGPHDAVDLDVMKRALDIPRMSQVALATVAPDGAERVCRELLTR
ncbi:MAG: glycosyl transferase [Nitrospirota bacterium]